jgi:hypothetical protein
MIPVKSAIITAPAIRAKIQLNCISTTPFFEFIIKFIQLKYLSLSKDEA